MTSEEYIETINKLMEMQNNLTNVWMTWIGLFLAAITVLQCWYNTTESKLIERRTREKILSEIHNKLDVEDLIEVKIKLDGQSKRIGETIESVAESVNLIKGTYEVIAHYGTSSFEVVCRQSIKKHFLYDFFDFTICISV